FYVNYAWGKENRNHVRLTGVFRTITYIDADDRTNNYEFGFGLKLTSRVHAGPATFYGMLQGGRAIAKFLKGNDDFELDLVPCSDPYSGDLTPTHSFGVIGAVQYNFTPNLFATGAYSFLRNYVPYYTQTATTSYWDQVRRGHKISANLVWRISDLFSAGVEYVHGFRKQESGETFYNNRVYGMFMMNF
ncbi:MAG: hypothetical protein HUK03_10030, partial [Bacteroidaceae bacterium]|nr:hypothetical protein [Bacteroidaceae bacterium]